MNEFKPDGGFTLVELIVVLVILAVLAAILVPTLTGYITQAQNQKDYDTCAELQQAAQATVIKQHTAHAHDPRGAWTYEALSPVATGDSVSVDSSGNNPGTREDAYVFQLSGVDQSRVQWFSFNVNQSGAITPVMQTNKLRSNDTSQARLNNPYPTAVCIDDKVYYMKNDGSWAAAVVNGNQFTTDQLTVHNCGTGTDTLSTQTTWTMRSK